MLRFHLSLALVRFLAALAAAAAYVESAIYAGFKTGQSQAREAAAKLLQADYAAASRTVSRAEERVNVLADRLTAAEDDLVAAREESELQFCEAEGRYDELLERLDNITL